MTLSLQVTNVGEEIRIPLQVRNYVFPLTITPDFYEVIVSYFVRRAPLDNFLVKVTITCNDPFEGADFIGRQNTVDGNNNQDVPCYGTSGNFEPRLVGHAEFGSPFEVYISSKVQNLFFEDSGVNSFFLLSNVITVTIESTTMVPPSKI